MIPSQARSSNCTHTQNSANSDKACSAYERRRFHHVMLQTRCIVNTQSGSAKRRLYDCAWLCVFRLIEANSEFSIHNRPINCISMISAIAPSLFIEPNNQSDNGGCSVCTNRTGLYTVPDKWQLFSSTSYTADLITNSHWLPAAWCDTRNIGLWMLDRPAELHSCFVSVYSVHSSRHRGMNVIRDGQLVDTTSVYEMSLYSGYYAVNCCHIITQV